MAHPVNADLCVQVLSPFIQFPSTRWTLGFHPATGFGIQHSTAQEFISMVTLGMFLLLFHLPAFLPPSFQRSKSQPHHQELVTHPSWKSYHFAAPEQDKGLIGVPKASCFLIHEEQAIPEKEVLSREMRARQLDKAKSSWNYKEPKKSLTLLATVP